MLRARARRDRRVDRLRERRRRPGRAGVRRGLAGRRPDGAVRRRAAMFDEDLLVVDDRGRRGSVADARPAVAGRRRGGLRRAGARPAATTCARTGSPRWCSGCRAGSTRRWSRRSRSTRSAPTPCAASRCRRRSPSPESLEDADACAEPLGHPHRRRADRRRLRGVPSRARGSLRRQAARTSPRRTCRRGSAGNLLMALSNKFGSMVLATGNKSEYAVGLLHAVRRHGGRVRADQGRAQDLGVRAVPLAERAAPGADADPRARDHEAAVGRAAARPEGHRLASALRRARPDHRGLRRGRPGGRRHRRRAASNARRGARRRA